MRAIRNTFCVKTFLIACLFFSKDKQEADTQRRWKWTTNRIRRKRFDLVHDIIWAIKGAGNHLNLLQSQSDVSCSIEFLEKNFCVASNPSIKHEAFNERPSFHLSLNQNGKQIFWRSISHERNEAITILRTYLQSLSLTSPVLLLPLFFYHRLSFDSFDNCM